MQLISASPLPAPTFPTLTADDVRRDLEVGRSLPLPPVDRLLTIPTPARPTAGGRTFLRLHLTARSLGRLHPRLARRALLRLWGTPWVHPSALRPIGDVPDDLVAWDLPVDGAHLRGYAGGTGPTAVLVHGWAGRAADWRHLARDLIAAGWRVVVPDLPAHGATAGERSDLFELGRALRDVLDRERPVAVVAHSLGFPTTLRAIEEGAGTPVAIVALAPGRRISRAVEGFAVRAKLPADLVHELRRGIEERYGADIWEVLDVDRVLPDLQARGLVVHDVDDDEVPLEDGHAIAERWPGAALAVTRGLGHRRILRDEAVRARVVHTLASTT